MRLKSRTKFPPGQFRLLLPEIGMPKAISGSFNEIVDAFARIVASNPVLAEKHGWPTNREDQENWIDAREANRLVKNGWYGFVDLEGEQPPQKKTQGMIDRVGSVVGESKSALAIYKDMFAGERPVERELAESRAATCVTCDLNDRTKSFTQYFTNALAKSLTQLIGMLNDLDIRTSHDANLGTCQACKCVLAAKCHIPFRVIKSRVPQDQWEALDPGCWLRRENGELTETHQVGITGNA